MSKCKFSHFIFLVFIFQMVGLSAPVFGSQKSEKNKIEFNVEKFSLENGLTVLIHENHSMPILSYQQWFRVGSSREKVGRTGLAHFFEHLMFKGTAKYPNGKIDRIIQMNGGSYNAFTSEDYTGYYANLPSDKLELIIDIESDRMRKLLFDEKEINSEREVVKEERRMRLENSVYGSLFELIRQTRFKTSPYRWPVIGYMEDLNATKIDELKFFYNQYYAPNNAVVVIAGDVNLKKAKELINKYYAPITRQPIAAFNPTPEVEQTAPRTAKIEKDVQGVTVAIVYPGVPAGHADELALDLLSNALGAGTSSRLYKKLVYNNQLATDVSVASSPDQLAGDFYILISYKPGANLERGLALIEAELAGIKKNPLSDIELQKLKNQVMLTYVKGLQTMSARAHSLALNEIIFGDYRRLFDDFEKYQNLTVANIQSAANTYLVSSKRSIVQIVPKTNQGSIQ